MNSTFCIHELDSCFSVNIDPLNNGYLTIIKPSAFKINFDISYFPEMWIFFHNCFRPIREENSLKMCKIYYKEIVKNLIPRLRWMLSVDVLEQCKQYWNAYKTLRLSWRFDRSNESDAKFTKVVSLRTSHYMATFVVEN